jgi:hypothetical protein
MTIFNVVDNELALTPMKTGKTRSWLGEYHWVSLPVTDDNKYDDTTEKATKWCHDSFGNSGARWFEKERKFYFKDEKDMTIFILRWS